MRASIDRDELLRLGPLIETASRFPERTNVQLVRVDGPHEVTALVWERGAGETTASGSSAVAVASAAIANGWCESPVTVQMPGGALHVELDDENQLTLVGPGGGDLQRRAGSLDGELELAQHVVQAQLLVVRLLPPADDQRAGHL